MKIYLSSRGLADIRGLLRELVEDGKREELCLFLCFAFAIERDWTNATAENS
jgi:hypothetical protein